MKTYLRQNIMKWLPVVLAGVIVAACQPTSSQPQELPTLAVLPSLTPGADSPAAATGTDIDTAPDTDTSPPAATDTPDSIASPEATQAPTETIPASPTRPPVTIEIREEVVFSTLTPGASAGTVDLLLADVVITEAEFQRVTDRAVAEIESIQIVNVDFVPEGIDVELTALGGQAFVTGNVRILIQVTDSFATIIVDDVTVNAAEPTEAFLQTVNGDFFPMMIQVLDTLLAERVGEGHDLENIVLNDEAMQVFLLVPQS